MRNNKKYDDDKSGYIYQIAERAAREIFVQESFDIHNFIRREIISALLEIQRTNLFRNRSDFSFSDPGSARDLIGYGVGEIISSVGRGKVNGIFRKRIRADDLYRNLVFNIIG